MVEVQANPDIESLKIWLAATVGIMIVLVGIVGYFLSKRDEAVTDAIKNLNEVVEQLKIVVNGVQLQQTIRQPIIEQQLELHRKGIDENAKKIEGIDLRLNTIETQHKDAYCRFPVRKKKGEE